MKKLCLMMGLGIFLSLDSPQALSQSSILPFPRLLKTWNDNFTPLDVEESLAKQASPEWLSWYRRHQGQERLHQTRIEFLDREQFFVKTPKGMRLVNTTRMDENVLLIDRRSFHFQNDQSLEEISAQMKAQNIGDTRAIAPLLLLIDDQRQKSISPSRIAASTDPSKIRSPASIPRRQPQEPWPRPLGAPTTESEARR